MYNGLLIQRVEVSVQAQALLHLHAVPYHHHVFARAELLVEPEAADVGEVCVEVAGYLVLLAYKADLEGFPIFFYFFNPWGADVKD